MTLNRNSILLLTTGALTGAAGIALAFLGNPANMGVCAACFIRDIAGALGFHNAVAVQYIRPEIPGFLLGAFIIAVFTRKWKPVSTREPLIRFVIAFFIMIGCLVFLGCPLRMALRIGAGDMNALVGLAGFAGGVFLGSLFLKNGFSLGLGGGDEPKNSAAANSLVTPFFAVLLLVFLVARPAFIRFSDSGPGSQHAPIILSFIFALVIGAFCQKSNFCIAGGLRDIFLIRKGWGFAGYIAIIAASFIGSLISGKFNIGFSGQPIAHSDSVWNFLGMFLAGYGSVLIGGCPLRQLIKAGSGDGDAGIAVIAFIAAGAVAHNFSIAASASGVPFNGKAAVVIGIAAVSLFAVSRRKRA
ncbi:MAG: YedE-related selenium metabolism membrane protein [Spirochaetaceae bacterium]|jgi:YedE family putative selenium metabolism protein|nr:YedE-related selenium metabolism membrane protein [Spirochaetaceae bacterium]